MKIELARPWARAHTGRGECPRYVAVGTKSERLEVRHTQGKVWQLTVTVPGYEPRTVTLLATSYTGTQEDRIASAVIEAVRNWPEPGKEPTT